MAALRIEHMYYKHDSIAEAVRMRRPSGGLGSRDDVHGVAQGDRRRLDCREDAPGFLAQGPADAVFPIMTRPSP